MMAQVKYSTIAVEISTAAAPIFWSCMESTSFGIDFINGTRAIALVTVSIVAAISSRLPVSAYATYESAPYVVIRRNTFNSTDKAVQRIEVELRSGTFRQKRMLLDRPVMPLS